MIELISYLVDPDKTEKFVFNDGNGVLEIVRINTKEDRDIFCVPSMYQCLLGCKMCYLTINNIKGSNKMVPSQHIDYVVGQIRKNYPTNKEGIQISVMGVGDPLLNIPLINELCNNEKYERVSISTIFPLIPESLPDKLKIHFSLHSPFDEKRSEIIPNNKQKIDDILYFLDKHNGKVEFHYTLMNDVNDSDEELNALTNVLNEHDTIKFLDFKTSEKTGTIKSRKLGQWLSKLDRYANVEYYNPPGEKIQGSCGLFTEGFYSNSIPNKEFIQMISKYSKPVIND